MIVAQLAIAWAVAFLIAGFVASAREIWDAFGCHRDTEAGQKTRDIIATGIAGITFLVGTKLIWWMGDDIEGAKAYAADPDATTWDLVRDTLTCDTAVFIVIGSLFTLLVWR